MLLVESFPVVREFRTLLENRKTIQNNEKDLSRYGYLFDEGFKWTGYSDQDQVRNNDRRVQ